MNSYIIKEIIIKNFKSIDEAKIVIDGANLNVLDGPNGFGKTTIYDAIQLLITGSVRRIEKNKIITSNRGFEDHLFSKNQTLPTSITIEFADKISPEKKLVFQREHMAPSNLMISKKKPQDFSNYKLYQLVNIDDEKNKKELSEDELNDLFGMRDLKNRFNLYHYIEQEESTHLFKKSDKERMNVISKLFNMEKEVNQKDYFEKCKSKLIAHRSSLSTDLDNLESDLENESTEEVTEFSYKPLISQEKVLKIPWDKKTISPLDEVLKQEYLKELDIISNLILNKEDFRKKLINEEIDNVISDEEKLKKIIILGNLHGEVDNLEKQNKIEKKLNMTLIDLENREIARKKIDWNFVFHYVKLPFEQKIVEDKVNMLKSYKKNSNNLSEIIAQINQTRAKLEKEFFAYTKQNTEFARECPLCGESKESLTVLIDQTKKKTERFKELLDSNAKVMDKELNILYEEYIDIITGAIKSSLKANSLDEKFIKQLLEYRDYNLNIEKAKKWFTDLNIDINKYISCKKEFVDDVDERVQQIQKDLKMKKLSINEYTSKNFKHLSTIFENRLDKSFESLEQIDNQSIKDKKSYVEYQYYLQTSANFKKVSELKRELKKINNLIESLKNIIKVYSEKINIHQAKMISDIEIPFYIYSGKIIQNHQRGLGVFIKEEKEKDSNGDIHLKTLNFVPPVQTDHDIVHSFSSGQLSSTVIAFTLALNKVYGNSGIMTLLIDDPVQTMDEMNMASFVDLIRNDFNDRQLIVSTHEDNVSLYLRYKFLKYGMGVGNINVRQSLYQR